MGTPGARVVMTPTRTGWGQPTVLVLWRPSKIIYSGDRSSWLAA